MDKFEIGEIAISTTAMGGIEECEIIALPNHGMHGFVQSDYIIDTPLDINRGDKSGFWSVREQCLSKKKPKEEPATWQEIQQLTNWNPTKEVAL